MSMGNSCICKRKRGDIDGLVCTQYKCNHSAFNGYHYTPSDYSTVYCKRCGAVWRTKAKFVDQLTKEG